MSASDAVFIVTLVVVGTAVEIYMVAFAVHMVVSDRRKGKGSYGSQIEPGVTGRDDE